MLCIIFGAFDLISFYCLRVQQPYNDTIRHRVNLLSGALFTDVLGLKLRLRLYIAKCSICSHVAINELILIYRGSITSCQLIWIYIKRVLDILLSEPLARLMIFSERVLYKYINWEHLVIDYLYHMTLRTQNMHWFIGKTQYLILHMVRITLYVLAILTWIQGKSCDINGFTCSVGNY